MLNAEFHIVSSFDAARSNASDIVRKIKTDADDEEMQETLLLGNTRDTLHVGLMSSSSVSKGICSPVPEELLQRKNVSDRISKVDGDGSVDA